MPLRLSISAVLFSSNQMHPDRLHTEANQCVSYSTMLITRLLSNIYYLLIKQ